MKKIFFTIFLAIILIGCQREKVSEIGVSHNKTLIIPPTDDLPVPKNSDSESEKSKNNNFLVGSILDKTEAYDVNSKIIDEIDEEKGYRTDKKFYDWLFKDKKDN